MKTILITKLQVAAAAMALVLVIGGAVLAQPAPTGEAAKPPPAKNIVHVATDGTGDYKTDGTDDHVEINQALSDIHKKGGGTVHLKKGTYIIDDSIIMRSNTTLEGDGWSSVITVKDDHDWPRGRTLVTNERGAHDIAIRNLKIDGKRDKWKARTGNEGWGGPYQKGIDLVRASNATLSGLWVGNNRSDAIHGSLSKNITIRDCTLEDCGHDDVYLWKCDTAKILNNRMMLRCNGGIRIYNMNHVVIRGNTLHAVLANVSGKGGTGICFQNSRHVEMNDLLIEGNRIFATMGEGIRAVTDSTPTKPSLSKIVVRNNVIFHCHQGIRTANFDMLVENNTIFNNRGSGIAFDHRKGPADFPVTVTARNNIIASNFGYGLTTRGVANARIISSRNNVWNNAAGNYDGNVKVEHDISVNPLFVNGSIPFARGTPKQLKMDLHLKSQHGRWDGKKWVEDDVTSPCLDGGDPSFAYSKEPAPNGKRINLGGYGNTEYASKSTGMARGVIAGKVTDKDSGKPVSGAKLSTGGYFGTTDATGNYTIMDVPVSEYSLKVSAIRYVEQVQKVKVSKDGKTVADLGMVKEKVPPTVKSHSPSGKNPVGKIISVVFSEAMNATSAEKALSVSPSVKGSFRWIGSTMYFIPDSPLKYGTEYKLTIDGAEDLAGNKLESPRVWEFSTLSKAEHLVGEWRFEEDSADTAKDSSGRGNHGKFEGNPAHVEGKVGKALSLDGIDDRISVPHNNSLIAREEITLEAWVKPDHQKLFGHHCGIVGMFPGPGVSGYRLLSYSKRSTCVSSFGFSVRYSDGRGKHMGAGFKHAGAWNRWVFLAATRDSHGNVRMYVDGKETNSVKTDPIEETIFISERRDPLWIGWWKNGRRFKGLIDEVRIYNRALSSAEIKADFERNK